MLSRIHRYQIESPFVAENSDNFLRFVFPHQSVVDVNAGQAVGDRLLNQRRRDRAVHAARQSAKHLSVPDLFADFFHAFGDKIAYRPTFLDFANGIQKVFEYLPAVFRMIDLGMKLYAVNFLFDALQRGYRTGRRSRRPAEACGNFAYVVAVTHPDDAVLLDGRKQLGLIHVEILLSVFADGRGAHNAAEPVRDVLHAVAYAENGHSETENFV